MLGKFMLSGVYRIFRKKDSECAEVRKASSEYLEGSPSGSLLQRIKGHLDLCRPCAAFVNSLSATVRMLSNMGQKEPPPNLKSNIIQRVEKGREERR